MVQLVQNMPKPSSKSLHYVYALSRLQLIEEVYVVIQGHFVDIIESLESLLLIQESPVYPLPKHPAK